MHLVVIGVVARELLDVPVDDHRYVIADVVGGAAGRVTLEVAIAPIRALC